MSIDDMGKSMGIPRQIVNNLKLQMADRPLLEQRSVLEKWAEEYNMMKTERALYWGQ